MARRTAWRSLVAGFLLIVPCGLARERDHGARSADPPRRARRGGRPLVRIRPFARRPAHAPAVHPQVVLAARWFRIPQPDVRRRRRTRRHPGRHDLGGVGGRPDLPAARDAAHGGDDHRRRTLQQRRPPARRGRRRAGADRERDPRHGRPGRRGLVERRRDGAVDGDAARRRPGRRRSHPGRNHGRRAARAADPDPRRGAVPPTSPN